MVDVHAIALAMNVKPITIEIATTFAFKLSCTVVINRINAVAATCQHQGVEIPYSYFIYSLLMKLFQAEYLFTKVNRVFVAYPKRPIHV